MIGQNLLKRVGGTGLTLMALGGLFVALPSVALKGATADEIGAAELGVRSAPDTLEIEVTLSEFSISPNPLRLPAGRPIRLVIRNAGQVDHEFMAGREPEEGDFEHDLFEGVSVEISDGAMAMAGHEEAEAGQQEEQGHEHGEADAAHEDAGQADAGHGDDHGTMVLLGSDQTSTMTFTIPASKRGEWTTACFLPGHFQAGMKGTLIVE